MKFKIFNRVSSVEKILSRRYEFNRFSDFLKSLSHKELHKLGEKIVYKNMTDIIIIHVIQK